MTAQGINLELPPSLYQKIKEMAEASQKSLSEVLIQSIRTGAPPSLDKVPERFQTDLKSLSRLNDELLFEIMEQELSNTRQRRYEALLRKNEQGPLEESEQQALSTVREEADLLMFRRAYAAALLKWRGHRVDHIAHQ